jgi:hypothetical protein
MAKDIAGWRMKVVADNILFVVGFGVWDTAKAQVFCDEYKELSAGFGEEPWAVLGDATDWILDDVKVQKIIQEQNRWIVSAGCRAGCFYTGPGALNRLLLYRLAEPDSDSYRFRVYPDRMRAVQALMDAGFSITDPQLNRFFRGEGSRPE